MRKYYSERREGMKRKILYILIVIAVLLLGGCIIKIYEDKKLQEQIAVEGIGHKIVFIISDMSYSEGYDHRGYFIDNCGNRYYYNLSDYEDYYSEDVYYEYLNEHIEEYEKEPYLEKERLYEAYKYLLKINKKAKIKEENVMVDYGSVRFWGIRPSENGEEEFILLEEKGDFEITVLDKNVDEVMEIISRDNWERDIWQKSKKETD